MFVTFIVAVARNGVIGKNGALPWHLPSDLERFKARTMGHPIVMGRKTYASIGKPLPGRTNIVITRAADFAAAGVVVARSPDEALAAAQVAAGNDECFVIGGAEIYRALLPHADRIELTRIDADVDGDTRFDVPAAGWHEVATEPAAIDDRSGLRWSVHVLERT
ncbi:MAG: dihydrofolate reductase [Planctomycetes bacterium]|nr:dihydrofolate reductase [Planctomycetota bacterium]MCC7169981.1 dihydrofolate reductase [Planctomycetota bacterium]